MEHTRVTQKTKAEPTSVSKKAVSSQRASSTGSLTHIPRWANFAYGNQVLSSLGLPTAQPPALDDANGETESITGNHLGIDSQPALEAGPREARSLQGGFEPTQHKENNTGMPDILKAGVEALSGISMDDVQVHYNSSKPAQLQALAYTQGTEIHVGPGQEEHLAHEAWHVVQQKQGRVKPTLQAKEVAINDDQVLEKEADAMGERASAEQYEENTRIVAEETVLSSRPPLQLRIAYYKPKDESMLLPGLANMNNMAKKLDEETEFAHGYVVTKLQEAQAGTSKLNSKDFPSSSLQRFNDWVNRLTGTNDSLKAATTGYIIEDIVTAAYGSTPGYTPQFGTGRAIPDFLLQDSGYRGVVDITSTGDITHILGKDFSIASFAYVVESLYPSIDFANIDTTAMQVSDETIKLLGKIRAMRAQEVLIHELGIIRNNLDLIINAGLLVYPNEVIQAALGARALVTNMTSNKNSIPSLRQDLDSRLRLIQGGQKIVTIRRLADIIPWIEDKYGVTGNPPWG